MSEVDSTLSPPQAPYSRPPDLDAHDQYPHHPATTAAQRQHYLSHYSHRTPSAGGPRTREPSWVSQFPRAPSQQHHNHFLPNANHHYANGVGHGAPPPPGQINIPPPAPIARGRSEVGSLAFGRPPTGFDAQEEYMNIDAEGIARDGNGYGIPRVPVPPVPPPRTPPPHPLASSSTPALLDGNGAVYPHPMEVEAPRNARKKKGGGGFVGGFFMGLLRGKSKKLKKKESIRGGRQITRLDDEDLVVEDGDGAGPSNADDVTTPGGGIVGRPPQYSSQPSTPVTNHVPTAIPYGTTTAPTVTTVPGTLAGGGDHISMPIPEVHEPGSPPPSNASTPTPIGRRPSLRVSVHPPSDSEDGIQRRDSMFSRPRTESEHPLPSTRHTSIMRHDADTPRRRVHSEGEVETLHRGHGRRDTRTTQTSQSTADRTYTTENTGRSGRSSGSPGRRETRRRRSGGGARRGVDEDDEDGVYQPNLQTTKDYRSMPRGADADSVATKNGALKLQQFFRDLAKLPWIRRHRITDDYQPHARADSRAQGPSKGGKRIIVVDEPVNWRKPTRWYYDVLPEGQKHSVDVDLTGGGPSSSGYTDSRSSRTHTLGSGSDRSREYERRRRHSDEHDQRRARDREHDRDRHRDRDRERRSPHSSSDHTISSPPPRRRENITSTSTASPRRHPHDQRISDSTASSNVRSPPARDGGHRTHKRRQHHSPPPPVPPIPPMHQTSMHHMPHMSSMNALNAPPGYATQPVVYAPALIPYPMAQAFASPMPMQQYHPGQPQMQQQQPIVIARSHDSPIPNVVNVNGSQAESGGGSQLMQQQGGPGGRRSAGADL
ncbi:hypothetical protein ONZ45_g5748 [Pleurotus djamor]|nr:hypothetical protein ONZ45_g5748 [Pleurotus djamor]